MGRIEGAIPFSERIKELMREYNLSQADIIKRTGIPKSSMSMYIKGSRLPKADAIYKIASAYSINPVWLNGLDVPIKVQNNINPEEAVLDARISNDETLRNAIKVYYSLTEEGRKEVLNFIRYKYIDELEKESL